MAGDWIPVSADLSYKPEVARIAEAIRRSPDEVVGILVRFWSWAQTHCSDGVFPGYTPDTLAKVARVSTSILRAMVSVGWLDVTETGTVIPEFDRWLSAGAKRRLLDRDRKRGERKADDSDVGRDDGPSGIAPEDVRKVSAVCPQVVQELSASCPRFVRNLSLNNNDDVDDDVKGEKGGVGEKGVGRPCNAGSVTSSLPSGDAVRPLFRTYARAWGPRGPTSKRDRVLLWRACSLAAQGESWAMAALESVEANRPNKPGAYLQKLLFELGPRQPHVGLILSEIPVPAEVQHEPPPSKTPREPPAESRPLSAEEGRAMIQEAIAAIGRTRPSQSKTTD